MMYAKETTQNILNGVDVDHLGETIGAVDANPALAHARWRASNTWVSGAHNRTSVQGFYAAGAEDESRESWAVGIRAQTPLKSRSQRWPRA